MLVVLSIFLVVLNMTGVFSALDEKVQQIVSARQKNIIADLSEQFGRMTAQGDCGFRAIVGPHQQLSLYRSGHIAERRPCAD